jgi:hypothetical protein
MISDDLDQFSFYQVKLKLQSMGKLYLHYLGSNQIIQSNYLVISPLIHLLFQRKLLQWSHVVEITLLLRKSDVCLILNCIM